MIHSASSPLPVILLSNVVCKCCYLLLLRYMVRDDVFIADIGGQALDIFPHSPESVQMTVTVKSYNH